MIKTIYDIPEHIFKTSYQNATIGHVLTPPKLALEMIETLPSDFIKSGIKILDPACKNGSFLFQLVIKQLDNEWTINEIENSLFTCDTLNASLNVAESGIKHIIRFPYQNSLIKINNLLYKHVEVELVYDDLIKTISKNKYISIRTFINGLVLDRKNNWLIVKFEENLIEFIKKYEGLSKTESKLFAEVFTPQALIEEMLDTLPADVWSNKDLKWLDPAVGIGNFPAAILARLMKGLEEVIVDSDERRKWILEEMLYMGDISTKNLFLLYQLFDLNNEFKLNVFRGDFLSEKFDKQMAEWGLDGFDLVVGNPPYQDPLHSQVKLWALFILKSLNMLKNSGFLTFVFPSVWLNRPDGQKFKKVTEIFSKYQLHKVVVDINKKWFNVGESTCYISLEKSFLYKETIFSLYDNSKTTSIIYKGNKIIFDDVDKMINDINDKISLKSKKYGKYKYYEDFEHNESKQTLFDDGRLRKEMGEDDLPIWYTASQKYYTNKKNVKLGWRVLINLSGYYYSPNDPKYIRIVENEGNTSGMRGVLCETKNEAENHYSILTSELYRFFNDTQKTSGFNTTAMHFPYLCPNKKYSDGDIYEIFEMSVDEISFIKKYVDNSDKKKSKKK